MKLRAPPDCTAVSHEGVEYPVEAGMVDVPDRAAGELKDSHGFTDPLDEADTPAVDGTPRPRRRGA